MSFSFADSSAVVCTEIIYQAFNGKGKLDFQLNEHLGRAALSADDIVKFYLQSMKRTDDDDDTNESSMNDGAAFDFVLLAMENLDGENDDDSSAVNKEDATSVPARLPHEAKIQTGEEGLNALIRLMED